MCTMNCEVHLTELTSILLGERKLSCPAATKMCAVNRMLERQRMDMHFSGLDSEAHWETEGEE